MAGRRIPSARTVERSSMFIVPRRCSFLVLYCDFVIKIVAALSWILGKSRHRPSKSDHRVACSCGMILNPVGHLAEITTGMNFFLFRITTAVFTNETALVVGTSPEAHKGIRAIPRIPVRPHRRSWRVCSTTVQTDTVAGNTH